MKIYLQTIILAPRRLAVTVPPEGMTQQTSMNPFYSKAIRSMTMTVQSRMRRSTTLFQ
jgi:hypothetical protein